MRLRTAFVMCLMVGLVSARSSGQAPQSMSVRALMSDAEFRRAGLTKLTPSELAELDAWLTSVARTVAAVSAESKSKALPSPRAILTLPDLEGGIIVATDGQSLERDNDELLQA